MSARFAVRGRLVFDGRLAPGAVVVDDGKVLEIQLGEAGAGSLPADVVDASIVAPGFVDVQVNGGYGFEAGDDPKAYHGLSAALPRTGVTAYLPTIVSSSAELYPRVFRAFAEARAAAKETPAATALGLHFEGPFLAPERKGAHRLDAIEAAPPALIDAWLANDDLKVVTLAPERPGAHEQIARLRAGGVVVSLGHTNATYEQFLAGIDAGASMVTHLFCAMSAFHHRRPGAPGAALTDDRVVVGLIFDGIHTHAASVRLSVKAKGVEGTLLVTDMIAGAGLGPGEYELGGQKIRVDSDSARLLDGTLAGSILTMDEAVRNCVSQAGTSIVDACRMASEVPARLLGIENKGRLAPGSDADLVLLDEDLRVAATYVGGERAFAAPASDRT